LLFSIDINLTSTEFRMLFREISTSKNFTFSKISHMCPQILLTNVTFYLSFIMALFGSIAVHHVEFSTGSICLDQ